MECIGSEIICVTICFTFYPNLTSLNIIISLNICILISQENNLSDQRCQQTSNNSYVSMSRHVISCRTFCACVTPVVDNQIAWKRLSQQQVKIQKQTMSFSNNIQLDKQFVIRFAAQLTQIENWEYISSLCEY